MSVLKSRSSVETDLFRIRVPTTVLAALSEVQAAAKAAGREVATAEVVTRALCRAIRAARKELAGQKSLLVSTKNAQLPERL